MHEDTQERIPVAVRTLHVTLSLHRAARRPPTVVWFFALPPRISIANFQLMHLSGITEVTLNFRFDLMLTSRTFEIGAQDVVRTHCSERSNFK